jgi:hypothetical protein
MSKTPRTRPRRQLQHREHQWIATEITIKLAVNGLLSMIAIVTLVKLLPYQFSQQQKLREVAVEVQETEKRVNELKDNFSRNFDPHQSKKVMEEQSPRVEPNQRRIFWLN